MARCVGSRTNVTRKDSSLQRCVIFKMTLETISPSVHSNFLKTIPDTARFFVSCKHWNFLTGYTLDGMVEDDGSDASIDDEDDARHCCQMEGTLKKRTSQKRKVNT